MNRLKDCYRRDGFWVEGELLSAGEIAALKAEALAVVSGERGPILGADVVSSAKDDREALMSEILAIHFPHKASDMMRDLLSHPKIVPILQEIIGPDVKCMQSMLFVKNAGKPGQAWHQDEFYIPTRNHSLTGVWIALDDATIENGCLWMHPGSHREEIIWPVKAHGDPRFDSAAEAYDFSYEREGGVPVEVKAGSVVFFDGYVLHRSLNNAQSSGFRRAIVNHYMSARSMLPWSLGFPPTPRTDFRDFVLVSGTDHYAHHGTEEITFPFLRPEDETKAAKVFAKIAEQKSS